MGNSENFIEEAIDAEIAAGKYTPDEIHTRFPPEPNGYLHIGHCKALIIDFGTAKKYGGRCNLRMDDTNPTKEDAEYVDAIKEDIHWLGFDWEDRFYYGSDYFEKTYELACHLIEDGYAYVCELSAEEFAQYRGDLTHPAVSPYRDRPREESLDLFHRMRAGEFPEGRYMLRAKIDLESGNFNMRDPVLYRIRYISHHRQGTSWCIFPMYDLAHPIQDYIEGVTHSLCSLEYEIHRPLYDWVIEHVKPYMDTPVVPRQIEFARLNLTYTVMSKRFLRYLVENGIVDGWDDPRMPTLCGLRRRGYTPESILDFIDRVGVAKVDSMAELELLEHCVREDLSAKAERRVAVIEPLRVIIDNFPDEKVEYFELPNNPLDESAGKRSVAFTREIYIEKSDFALMPPPKFFRLKPDGEVRLMGSYIIKYVSSETDVDGNVTAVHCTADIETGCGMPADGRKIKGTIHWVSVPESISADVIYYDKLFDTRNMNEIPSDEYVNHLNPDSAVKYTGCRLEKALSDAEAGVRYQFVRNGYFVRDTRLPNTYNRIVGLKDGYKK
ncbi:MAG: glutamine--tRNA ligase/YqeY domain fusion protein [Firmicutes bacterium]|nr:glutamine--tRNA ligase/YqeY domain fusion protein [Bacillota bacterium]